MFQSILAEIFEKTQASEIMMWKIFQVLFGDVQCLRKSEANPVKKSALIRQCHEPHLSEELRTEAALLFFLKSVDINFDCSSEKPHHYLYVFY